MTLKEMFEKVMNEYHKVQGIHAAADEPVYKEWHDHKRQMIEEIQTNSKLDFADTYVSDLLANGNAKLGSGKWANVFTISIRYHKFPSATTGVYITYLFNPSTRECYLALAQGSTEYQGSIKKLKERVRELRDKLKEALDVSGFDTTEPATSKADYNAGVIAHKKYTLASLPDDTGLYADLADMEKLYKYYLDNVYPLETSGVVPTSEAATYTDDRLCNILKKMLKDAHPIKRKIAALMVFGIVYSDHITNENLPKLVSVTDVADGSISSDQQIKMGKAIGEMQKEDATLDVFSVLDSATPATATDLSVQLTGLMIEAKKISREEATTIVFGIKNSRIMQALSLVGKDIDATKGDTIDEGRRIADFLEKFPQYAEKLPLVDANALAVRYANIVTSSYNVIFRGAPGTGKSYLAKSIAAYMVSENAADGIKTNYESLSDDEKERIGFVQFHPSYDYSDFVEGLRPVKGTGGEIVFDRKDGIFKEFVEKAKGDNEHKYVFIIDEINRGEISKILGELFFSIDPGYRGKEGSVFTQYSNMHADANEKFYIPENVYIIGTMNDIDRSVDTFDFAMRRRFRFIEIKANEHTAMLDNLGDDALKEEAIQRMKALNDAITDTEGLNPNYHIGAAYFLKLKDLSGTSKDKFDALWTDYLEPLLQEYINGMATEEKEMEKFRKAYNTKKYTFHKDGDEDEAEVEDADSDTAGEDDSSNETDED